MARTQTKGDEERVPRVTVTFPASDRERLRRIAEQHERSISWVVRHAVRTFLNERDKGQLDLDLTLPGGD